MIRLATSASQKDVYLCRIKVVLYSAPPRPVSSGLEVQKGLLSTSVLLSMRRNHSNPTGSYLLSLSKRL